jgi:glycerate kinase
MRNLKILIALDSFKGSLTSREAGRAVEEGLAEGLVRLGVEADFTVIPIADGGEGTVDAFHAVTGGELVPVACQDPLGGLIEARLLILPDTRTAVIEMAASCGLPLVQGSADVLRSDTFGLGQQIMAAFDRGVQTILVGIGGSATNDGGAGMARALGARFFDVAGQQIGTTPIELERLGSVDLSRLDKRAMQAGFQVMCDVTNPLLGPSGAAKVYSPQKGAGPAVVDRLESIGRHYADVVEAATGSRFRDLQGSGAAGGLGFGLCAYLNARLRPGIEVVLETTRFAEQARGASLLITGEGRLDAQSLQGKAPWGVARIAAALGLPCVAFCGSIAGLESVLVPQPFSAIFQVVSVADSLSDAISRAPKHLRTLARRHAGDVYRILTRAG